MKISGWGRYPKISSDVKFPFGEDDLNYLISINNQCTPRGSGRSYGDSSISELVIQSDHFDHYIDFDYHNGIIECESGIKLIDLNKIIIPKGWFLPVTPGTSYITIGGALAADIHGKNHHKDGCFSNFIESFKLALPEKKIIDVDRLNHPDLFHATCGGMGLTGFIISVRFKLKKIKSNVINQSIFKCTDLKEVCELLKEKANSTYVVAWIDCIKEGGQMGRSVLFTGEHSKQNNFYPEKQNKFNIPFETPGILLNKYSIKTFNSIYYYLQPKKELNIKTTINKFFYPLDFITNWNLLYGSSGFFQFQFVLPKNTSFNNFLHLFKIIVESKRGSFLAVLKLMGGANNNYLSFPIEGFTLALDFKVTTENLNLARTLNHEVLNLGGKVYLAKDVTLDETSFKKMYPDWKLFQSVRAKFKTIDRFSSNQSRRIGLDQ